MILLFAVLAILSAAFLLSRYSRRQDPELFEPPFNSLEPPPNARPLFAPSNEELRREADENAARAIARREYRAQAGSRAKVDAALEQWRTFRDAKSTGVLLRVTAESGLEGDLTRAAGEIIEQFHGSGIDGLSNNDLAALLDSHIGLVSDTERASGAMFWLKQEATKLRVGKNG